MSAPYALAERPLLRRTMIPREGSGGRCLGNLILPVSWVSGISHCRSEDYLIRGQMSKSRASL